MNRQDYQQLYESLSCYSNAHVTSQWARVHWALPYMRGAVLEAGCQHGGITKIIVRQPMVTSLLATDITETNIAATRKTLFDSTSEKFVPYQLQNCYLEDIAGEEKFDTIVLFELLEHVVDPTLVLTNCQRLLRDKGHLLITVPFEDATKSPDHLRSYSVESFYKELSCLSGGLTYVSILTEPTLLWLTGHYIKGSTWYSFSYGQLPSIF